MMVTRSTTAAHRETDDVAVEALGRGEVVAAELGNDATYGHRLSLGLRRGVLTPDSTLLTSLEEQKQACGCRPAAGWVG
jgi:hypothetical protein